MACTFDLWVQPGAFCILCMLPKQAAHVILHVLEGMSAANKTANGTIQANTHLSQLIAVAAFITAATEVAGALISKL